MKYTVKDNYKEKYFLEGIPVARSWFQLGNSRIKILEIPILTYIEQKHKNI